MALEQVADRVVDTDVLVVGGGIGGCCAAAKAAEHDLNVTLAEKSKTDRSGSAGQGIDHYGGALIHERTPEEFRADCSDPRRMAFGGGQFLDPNIAYRLCKNGFWTLQELEKLGVTMRWDDGDFRVCVFGMNRPCLRVHWQNVKPEMAAAVRKMGVNVLERTMVVDLLANKGEVVGATAVNTRTGEFIVIKAKATVIATGLFARCYDPETPLPWKYKYRYHWCPATVSGDGWAVAYRAGAELASMELSGGGARWRDDLNLSFGNMLNEGIAARRITWMGEEYVGQSATNYAEMEQQGLTPLYYSFEHLPDDFHKRIEVAYADERLVSFKIAEDRGFNPRIHRYEVMDNRPHQFMVFSGINADGDFKASVNGLYAIGDCVAGCHTVGAAAAGGLLLGDSIHTFVSGAGEPAVDEAQVESQKQTVLAPLAVKDGTEPTELECAIRYICTRYVGSLRAEGKLREGIRRLGSLRRVFLPRLMAKNPHYLMRCLEVRNIMGLAEVHMQACLERKETRADHFRLDYPEIDPSRQNLLTYQRMEGGKPVLELREMPELKPEFKAELAEG